MPNTAQAKLRFGPETYKVSDSATGANVIDGGLLVEPDGTGTGKVKLAAVDSTKWFGVAAYSGLPDSAPASTDFTAPNGFPGFIADYLPSEIAVICIGTVELVNTGTALVEGDIVYCAAGGKIQKATTTGRAVGIVTNPGGIAANARGLVRLF